MISLTIFLRSFRDAEEALSAFRGENQLTNVDESMRGTLEFLSQLESEKIATDLQLAEYNTRLINLRSQLTEKRVLRSNLLNYLSRSRSEQFNDTFFFAPSTTLQCRA